MLCPTRSPTRPSGVRHTKGLLARRAPAAGRPCMPYTPPLPAEVTDETQPGSSSGLDGGSAEKAGRDPAVGCDSAFTRTRTFPIQSEADRPGLPGHTVTPSPDHSHDYSMGKMRSNSDI